MPIKSNEKSALMDLKQLSEYINLSTSRIYKMVAKKEIPHVRIASKILFSKEDIDNWVEERKVSIRTKKGRK